MEADEEAIQQAAFRRRIETAIETDSDRDRDRGRGRGPLILRKQKVFPAPAPRPKSLLIPRIVFARKTDSVSEWGIEREREKAQQ